MKKVAVVILNWNGEGLLQQFLPSVVASVPDYAEVIVADNASTDNSIQFLKENYPDIKIIENKTNGGFAKGYNEALQTLNHEFFVLLNSDVETPKGWVEPVAELMMQDTTVGAAMPKIIQYNKKTHFEYAGAAGGFVDKWGFPFCRGRLFNELEKDEGQYNEVCDVFWATGACMFVRRDVFTRLGGFDEFFFAHMEEIDLCWRIQRAGYSVKSVGTSKVFHLGGGTLNKISPRKTFLNFRNNLLLLVKNLTNGSLFWLLVQKLIFDWVAAVKFILEGNFKHALAVIKAYASFYKVLPKYLLIRKELKQKLRHAPKGVTYRKSIVFDHFIKGKKRMSELKPQDFI